MASNYYNHHLVHIKLHVLAIKLQALLVSKNIGEQGHEISNNVVCMTSKR